MAPYVKVTGRVIDPRGYPWVNATLVISFIPSPTATKAPTLGNGQTFQTVYPQADCDANGFFTRRLADNRLVQDGHARGEETSRWSFRFCTGLGYVPKICFEYVTAVTGERIDLTQDIMAGGVPVLPPICGGGGDGGVGPLIPIVSGMSPLLGPPGTVVTVTGSGFGASQGTSTISIGGVVVTPDSWSNNQITFTVPPGASTGYVVVNVVGFPSNGLLFTVLNPTIISLSPLSGPPGVVLTITGTDFGVTQGTSTVALGSLLLTVITWSDSMIVAQVPPDTPVGRYGAFTVTKPEAQQPPPEPQPPEIEPSAEIVPVQLSPGPPWISSITPNQGAAGTVIRVTIRGTGLTGTYEVRQWGGIGADYIQVVNDHQITAVFTIQSNPLLSTSGIVAVITPRGMSNGTKFIVFS